MGYGVRGGSGKPDPGAKREKYRLTFVDDNDQVCEVHKDLVVAVSCHGSDSNVGADAMNAVSCLRGFSCAFATAWLRDER